MKEFYEILAERIASDPTLSEAGLSIAAGLDNSTIRQMIAKKRNPRIDTARKICEALETTIEDFMSGSDDPQRAELRFLLDNLSKNEISLMLGAANGMISQRSQSEDQ